VPGRVLVTGIEGFTGHYLRATLEQRGYEVNGITRHEPRNPQDWRIDLNDTPALTRHLDAVRPDYLIHLAAITFVAHDKPAEIYNVNLLGTLNLLEAVNGAGSVIRKIILASSANVYGRPPHSPVAESTPAIPVSHYGVSKYAMELMAERWFDRLPVLLVRPFNYTGLGQDTRFIIPKAVKCFREHIPNITLGDTNVVREFMDVRDVCQAYVALLESPLVADTVNLCSSVGHRLDYVLEVLRGMTGFMPTIERKASLIRNSEIPELVGSSDKLRRVCGVLRFRPLEDTLRWMLDAPK
jgi:nucleoside-diphosphate-sugar epimerase